MESKLCMNCFAGYRPEEGEICPVCGWDNTKPQVQGGLRYHTVLASRYVIGRVKAMNGEGVTYCALDRTTKRVVEVREFFPASLAVRREDDQSLAPSQGKEVEYEQYLQEFIQLSKNVSRLRELSVVISVQEIFEENYTAYAVYEYESAVSLRRYVENAGGKLSWNEANRMFMPVLTALGLINSLGISHLGVSPDTLRVTKNGTMFLTGFSISAVRQVGRPLAPELFPGCAAAEQYRSKAVCGEASDVYGFAASLLFALTGKLPLEAEKRLQDQRLMISKDVLKSLPPFAVTAIANALQVKPDARTPSFERFKTELSTTPTIVNEVDQTAAIRRLPPIDMDLPQNKGLPPAVWLIGSCVITLVALIIVASMWLGDRGMSFGDLQKVFDASSAAADAEPVPNLVNQNYDEWVRKMADGEYHFKLKVSARIFSETVEEGNIISQSPFQNEYVSPGDTVVVTVSKGSSTRTLPSIKGVSFAELQENLTKNGFIPKQVEEHSDDIEPGYVIRYQDHEEGESLDYGAEITVVVSAGPEG